MLRCGRMAVWAMLLLGTGIACGPAAPPPGSSAPVDFSLKDLSGNAVRFQDSAGKVRLVNVWASWCAPCVREIPTLNRLQGRLGPRGLQVYGLSADDTEEDVRRFVRTNRFEYPVVWADQEVLDRLGFRGSLPLSLLVGPDGKVARRYEGLTEEEVLAGDIEELLRK